MVVVVVVVVVGVGVGRSEGTTLRGTARARARAGARARARARARVWARSRTCNLLTMGMRLSMPSLRTAVSLTALTVDPTAFRANAEGTESGGGGGPVRGGGGGREAMGFLIGVESALSPTSSREATTMTIKRGRQPPP